MWATTPPWVIWTYGERVPLINYDVPDELHRRCKVAAAKRGQTLKDFLMQALEAEAKRAEAD